MNNILVIAPHPDDETLGCGGTVLKHISKGDKVYWLILTNVSKADGWDEAIIERRDKEISDVAKAFGFEAVLQLGIPTTKLDQFPMNELVKKIVAVLNEVKPHTIYLNNRSDIHTDHQVAFRAVTSCTKNFRYPFIQRILLYETLSETEFAPALPESVFVPNVFIDISAHMEKKAGIMKIYASELMKDPLPRSLHAIYGLAAFRGSRIGEMYAEAFMLLFEKQE